MLLNALHCNYFIITPVIGLNCLSPHACAHTPLPVKYMYMHLLWKYHYKKRAVNKIHNKDPPKCKNKNVSLWHFSMTSTLSKVFSVKMKCWKQLLKTYTSFPLGQQAYQKPASTCSSSSNHSILSAQEAPGALELGEEVEVEYHETTLTPAADQTEKLVNVLNSSPESELKLLKYINSKMAAGIIAHREEKGQISRLEELLVIPGVGRWDKVLHTKTMRDTDNF